MLLSIALILLLGLLLGSLFSKIKLPSLLGMILVGIVLGPHALNLIDGSILNISADLRQIALVIILTRAGLSLDLSDLKKLDVRQSSCALCRPAWKWQERFFWRRRCLELRGWRRQSWEV